MKLDSIESTETNSTFNEKIFSIKQSPIAFDILSNKLYSNPKLAIIRELLCNAYDSHVVAGTTDIPIDITIPDSLENNLIIRDYGTGLSKEDVLELYTTFFNSTKSDNNTLTGGFGLGSKTPFAYSPSFSVTSYYNGIEYQFIATKKDGYPSIIEISNKPTNEHNGLKITIPIREGDRGSFIKELYDYIRFIPEIKINSNKEIIREEPIYTIDNISIYNSKNRKYNIDYYCSIGDIYIKQGQNIYSILNSLSNYTKTIFNKNSFFKDLVFNSDLVIEVPIGTIPITPNRESLNIDNKAIITNILNKAVDTITNKTVINDFVKYSINNIDKFSENKSFVIKLICDYYFNNEDTYGTIFYNHDYHINTKIYDKLNLIYRLANKYVLKTDNKNNDIVDCNYILNNTKTYIVFTSSAQKHKANFKIDIITKNNEDLTDCNVIIVPLSKKYYCYNYGREELSPLEIVRQFKNLAFILNSYELLNFDIECLFLKDFLNKFKVDKKLFSRNVSKYTTNNSVYKCLLLRESYIDHKYTYSLPINDIKTRVPSNKSILITINNCSTTKLDDVYEVLRFFTYNISNNKSLFKFFKNKLNINNEDEINLFSVANSNLQYFKEYIKFDMSELVEFLDFANFKYKSEEEDFIWNINKNTIKIVDEGLHKNIDNRFSAKELNFIKNTYWYKRFLIIKSINDKIDYFSLLNLSSTLFNRITEFISEEKLKTYRYKININRSIINSKDYIICNDLKYIFSTTRWNYKKSKLQLFNLLRGKYNVIL